MKLVLAEPKYFKESVSIISDLVSEAKFKVNQDGLELVAMDPANVAMVIFKLLSSSFTQYEIKQPEEIAINLNNLKCINQQVFFRQYSCRRDRANLISWRERPNDRRIWSSPTGPNAEPGTIATPAFSKRSRANSYELVYLEKLSVTSFGNTK